MNKALEFIWHQDKNKGISLTNPNSITWICVWVRNEMKMLVGASTFKHCISKPTHTGGTVVNFAQKKRRHQSKCMNFFGIYEEKQCLIIFLSVPTVWKTCHQRFQNLWQSKKTFFKFDNAWKYSNFWDILDSMF